MIKKYARKNNIEVRRFTPNFRSRKSEIFKSVVVVGRNVGEELEEEIVDKLEIDDETFFKIFDREYESK